MKRSVPIVLALICFASFAPADETPKEDDFLIFDKIEEDQAAIPFKPTLPSTTEGVKPSARPLPGEKKATLRTILLHVPEKSFATGRLATVTAIASQQGKESVPLFDFSGATLTLSQSLEKAAALVAKKNAGFPDGVTLKVTVDGGYETHERDAAGVVSAILLESIGTGKGLDADAALLGGVDDQGRITAVHRLATRLRTIEGTFPTVTGVPAASEVEVRDLALMNEFNVLTSHQIVSLATLEDARLLASKNRPENMTKAITLFAGVTTAAATTPVDKLLKNAKFLERLREISTLMPNHLSARLLLQSAAGKVPGRITFATSRQAILKATKPFVEVTSAKRPVKEIKAVATEGGNVLLRIQPKIHPSVERYLVSMKAYLRAVNNFMDIPATQQHMTMRNRAAADINKLLATIQAEKVKLDQQEAQHK